MGRGRNTPGLTPRISEFPSYSGGWGMGRWGGWVRWSKGEGGVVAGCDWLCPTRQSGCRRLGSGSSRTDRTQPETSYQTAHGGKNEG